MSQRPGLGRTARGRRGVARDARRLEGQRHRRGAHRGAHGRLPARPVATRPEGHRCSKAQGAHFSFGASVAGAPARAGRGHAARASTTCCCGMLDSSRRDAARRCAASAWAAGWSWSMLCHRVFAAPRRAAGPARDRARASSRRVASLVLPERVGRRHAEDLCLSGRTRHRRGGAGDGPGGRALPTTRAEAALAYARAAPAAALGLQPALRRRARCAPACAPALAAELAALERLYLDELMATRRRRGGPAGLPREAHARPGGTRERHDHAAGTDGAGPRRLYRDYRLGAVREWKARTGGLAVGYMPIYVPRELLHAQGVLPVGPHGRRATTSRSSRATPTTSPTSATSRAAPSSWG